MAYQDDFRNKVLAALKAKNLAVDISQEATQQAIVQEAQNVAASEAQTMSSEEMTLVLQDVARTLASENGQAFTAQSYDFTAYQQQVAGGPGGSYSGGGIAMSTANKDIMIIPAGGALGAAGSATSVNSLSQIDFKHIANPNAYNAFDPNEVKASLFNWAERISGNLFDTPVLGLGGAWGGVSYAPMSGWGIGVSQGSGVGASINTSTGFGQIIYFKPATSTIYASLFNDIGLDTSAANGALTLTGYAQAVPGSFPTAGFAVTFGGIGGSGDLVIQGAALSTQVNTARFASSMTVANNTVTDTLTLSLSSASGGLAGTQFFVGNGSTQQYVLSSNALFSAGDIFYASGSGHTHLVRLPIGTNNSYLFSNGSVPSWTSSIAANTVAVNPTGAGSTILYPLLNNLAGAGSAISTDIDFSVDPGNNILRYASGSFYVGTAVSSPLFTGITDIDIRAGANSATGVQITNLAGTNAIVNVDSVNNRVGINNVTSPAYTLDVAGDINAATGQSIRINGNVVLNGNTLGSVILNSSLTSVGTIATGVWQGSSVGTTYGGTGSNLGGATGNANKLVVLGSAANGYAATLIDGAGSGNILTSNNNASAPSFVAPGTLSVGFASTSANNYVSANVVNADNYITFTYATGTAPAGVGLSISNVAANLTYNPGTQQLKVTNITGTAFTATNLTGTLQTASQPNITSASALATVGTITSGTWQGTAVGTTYGGTGSNLGSATGNTNKLVVLGSAANGYAATLVDGGNTGYLLAANGNISAPTFVNSTNAAFSFAQGTLTINNAAITTGTISTAPTNANDLVNKSYADSLSGGLDPHASVRLTTVSAIGGSYRQAGTAGTLWGDGDYIIARIPATLIGSESGFDTPVSGIALTLGQRVLVKDGVTGGYASGNGAYGAFPTTYGGFAASWVANGIYTVTSYGGAATSGWLLIRATDTDNQSGVQELTGGTFTFVEEGTTYADNAFVCTNDTTSLGPIGFGSTQISWSAFSGGASLTMGQGLSKTGNTIAANFNLAQSGTVNANLSTGFSIGGARSGSVGSSSFTTFTVDGASLPSTNTLTALGTGFSLAGGQTNRTLTVQGTGNITLDGGGNTLTLSGSSITLTGGGFTLTLNSSSTASFNSQTLALTAGMGNLTFNAGNTTPSASTQNIVQNGVAQYQLSTSNNTFASGDLYFGAGAAFTALSRLALGGTGASVLIRNTTQPVWGTIALASSDYVSGQLTLTNGGTNANLTAVNGGAVYSTGTALAITAAGTAGSVLMSTGAGAPVWQQITLSNTNSVSGQLTLANGGTGANLTAVNGGAVYSTGSALAITGAGTAGSVLMSTGAGAPVWQQITLSNTNSVSGVLAMANGGTNSNTSNFTANGVVIYDSANTRLASATGLTMLAGVGLSVTGTVSSTGGFFTGGNSVVTSVQPTGGSAIYGGVGISVTNNNPAGILTVSGSGQTITINGPGTGITGTGAATQVAYYNATRELTGNVGLVYSPTAATGVGLSVNANTASGTILQVNSAQTMTSGFLMDIDNNGSQRYTIDFKGMATHTVGSGFTGLIVSGGRTILSAATANYATINLPSSAATNPGAGVTQVGDLWFNGTNLYFRKDATTNFDLLVGSVSGSGTANKIAKWSTSSALTDSNITDAGVGMTITSTSSIGPGTGSTALLTLQTLATDDTKTDRFFIRGAGSGGTRYFSVDTSGNLRATTKSFDIPHPTKEGMRLVYGVLEGPEHGVYHRGTVEGKGVIQVNLPEYWHKLVGDQYTIQITPWGNYSVGIGSKTENYFTIQLVGDVISRKFKNIKVDYIVHGSRLDAPLDIEQ